MSNSSKDRTLGMPHGTANGRLRKNILFHLLKKHNENVCVRCGRLIDVVEDLSIEHIKPWEGVSADLFWDLSNIAFSHLKCNIGAVRTGVAPPNKIVCPAGFFWCYSCRAEKQESEFYTPCNGECKSCKSRRNSQRVRTTECRSGRGVRLQNES